MGEAPIAATDGMVFCRWCASFTAPAPFCQQCGSPSPKGQPKVRSSGPAEGQLAVGQAREAASGEVIQISCKWCCQLGPLQSLCANCGSPMLGNSSIAPYQSASVAKARPVSRPAARAIGPPPTTDWLKTRELAEALSVSLAAIEAEDQREAVVETAPGSEPLPELDASDPGEFEMGAMGAAASDNGSPEAYLVVTPEVNEPSQPSSREVPVEMEARSDTKLAKRRLRPRKGEFVPAPETDAVGSQPQPEVASGSPKLESVAPTPEPEAVIPTPEPKVVAPAPEPKVAASAPKPKLANPAPKPKLAAPADPAAATDRTTGASGPTPSAPGAPRANRPISAEKRVAPSPGKTRKLLARGATAATSSQEIGRSKSPIQADDPNAHHRQMPQKLKPVPEPSPSVTLGRNARGVEPGAEAPPEKKRRFLKKRDGGRDKLSTTAPEQAPPRRVAPVVESQVAREGRPAERVDMNPYRVRAAGAGSEGESPPSGKENPGGKAPRCRSCGKSSQWGMCETCSEAFGELRELSASLGIDEIA